jgi:hypothetical protein
MTKFRSEHDEYLWSGSVESGVITGDGDVAGPVGWFAGITLVPMVEPQDDDEQERAALEHYGTPWLILHESNEGFVTVLTFDDEVKRNRRLIELGHAHDLGTLGIEERSIVDAITGYRKVLEWQGGHDGRNLSWSDEAQRQTSDDVTDFIIAEAEDVKVYMETLDREWQHVGGDLAYTRNGVGEGFGFFAGGEVPDRLVQAAFGLGPVRVVVNEQEEMEVQS